MNKRDIVPMEPSVSSKVPAGKYFYQVKWDGIRILAFGENSKLYLQGKHLKDKTRLYPELNVLIEMTKARNFVLDGEIITLQNDIPCFYSLMHRERASAFSVPSLARKFPVYYMVFDILALNDEWLLSVPLQERLEILESTLEQESSIFINKSFNDGEALLKSVKEKNMEGIVSKHYLSPYIPGPKKSSYWLKTKVERTLKAYVGGISLKEQRPTSLLLGIKGEDDKDTAAVPQVSSKEDLAKGGLLYYVGSLSSGLREQELNSWYDWSLAHKINISPFVNSPSLLGRKIIYVEPIKRINVSFLEWTPSLKLRAPRAQKN